MGGLIEQGEGISLKREIRIVIRNQPTKLFNHNRAQVQCGLMQGRNFYRCHCLASQSFALGVVEWAVVDARLDQAAVHADVDRLPWLPSQISIQPTEADGLFQGGTIAARRDPPGNGRHPIRLGA